MLHLILQVAVPDAMGGQWSSLIMIGLIFVVFYFFMIRPQSKKQKEISKFREAMKAGDKVVTAGGIHGKVKEVSADKPYLLLEISEGVVVRIDKGSVFQAAADAPAK